MPAAEIRYAILAKPEDPDCKPTAYQTEDDLTRRVKQLRGSMAIELEEREVHFAGEAMPHRGVSVWRQGLDGGRASYLGWIYIAGGGRERLQAALDAGDGVIMRRRMAS